jgi:glycosyltransferase involved in cell wall biosynthesis
MKYSIIIPTYNRAPLLEKLLKSITEIDYDKDQYEVIIIDDGSKDKTPEIADKYMQIIPMRYIRQDNSGPSKARNMGIDLASGEFVTLIDDDCTSPNNWLKKADEFLERSGADGLCGISTDRTGIIYSSASQFITNYLFNKVNNYFKLPVFVMSNNIIYRKSIFKYVGKFSAEFSRPGGEDRELNFRILKAGYKIIHSENFWVNHYHELSFKSFIRQQFNYGIGSFGLKKQLKTDGMKGYQTPVRIYFKIFPEIIKNYKFPQNIVVMLLFSFSQVSVIFGMLYNKFFLLKKK